MAKKPKVPLNVLVVDGTREAVKRLSNVLECSQGEVIDRAVVLLDVNHDVAKGLAGLSPPAESRRVPVTRSLREKGDGKR